MSDLKIKEKKKKSSIDLNSLKMVNQNTVESTQNANKGGYQTIKRGNNSIVTTNKSEKGSNLSSTNPSLVKLSKHPSDLDFQDIKIIKDPEIEKIVDKYQDASFIKMSNDQKSLGLFNFEREKSENVEIQVNFDQDNANKIKIPVLNLNVKQSINSKNEQQEYLFDPVTERDCSFINNISVDNSNFCDENKENDVVLCIPNLEIDMGIKRHNILQSDQNELFEKNSQLNDVKNLITDQLQKKKWIENNKLVVYIGVIIICLLIAIILITLFK